MQGPRTWCVFTMTWIRLSILNKQTQPKRKEWIDDYYMQIAAYAMAHDYIHGSSIEQGIIMVCTPDLYLQEFRFQGVELRSMETQVFKKTQ